MEGHNEYSAEDNVMEERYHTKYFPFNHLINNFENEH